MKVKCKPGDLFAMPLLTGGILVGLIARKNKYALLGYFFDKIYIEVPDAVSLADINKQHVLYIAKFGSTDIDSGAWPLLRGKIAFNKEEWPIPLFQQQDLLAPDTYWGLEFDETLVGLSKRRLISREEASKLFPAAAYGSVALQKHLTSLFG